jgi:hypothetical protein
LGITRVALRGPGSLYLNLTGHLFVLQAKNSENELAKASIGSVEYISSLYRSNGESEQIKQAVKCSAFGPEFVQAALSVDKKVS